VHVRGGVDIDTAPYTPTDHSANPFMNAKNGLGGGTDFGYLDVGCVTLFISRVTAVCEKSLPLTDA
jgi:hypothetical protein